MSDDADGVSHDEAHVYRINDPKAMSTESDTERDGFLSYTTEWHALIIGSATGLVSALTAAYELAALLVFAALGLKAADAKGLREVRREPWYALGGLTGLIALVEVVQYIL